MFVWGSVLLAHWFGGLRGGWAHGCDTHTHVEVGGGMLGFVGILTSVDGIANHVGFRSALRSWVPEQVHRQPDDGPTDTCIITVIETRNLFKLHRCPHPVSGLETHEMFFNISPK